MDIVETASATKMVFCMGALFEELSLLRVLRNNFGAKMIHNFMLKKRMSLSGIEPTPNFKKLKLSFRMIQSSSGLYGILLSLLFAVQGNFTFQISFHLISMFPYHHEHIDRSHTTTNTFLIKNDVFCKLMEHTFLNTSARVHSRALCQIVFLPFFGLKYFFDC